MATESKSHNAGPLLALAALIGASGCSDMLGMKPDRVSPLLEALRDGSVQADVVIDHRTYSLGSLTQEEAARIRQVSESAQGDTTVEIRARDGQAMLGQNLCSIRVPTHTLRWLIDAQEIGASAPHRDLTADEIADVCGITPEEVRENVQISFHHVSPQPSAYTKGETRVRFDTLGKANETQRG